MMTKGIVGKVEHLKALLARYGAYTPLAKVIEEELNIPSCYQINDLHDEKEPQDEPTTAKA